MSIKRIDITEVDNTTPSGASNESDVVYVPGLVNYAVETQPKAEVGDVIAVSSDAEFVEYFGSAPVQFNNDPDNGSTPGVFDNAGINYSYDLSYIYARNLLKQGLTVAYEVLGNESATVEDIYTKLYENDGGNVSSCFTKLADNGEYDIKYITSGGYPSIYNPTIENSSSYVSNIAETMISVASERGDAVAVIDHASNIGETVYDDVIENGNFSNGEYGTLFTPWATYKTQLSGEQNLPASYGYLSALAKSIKTNANYLAVAGVARGLVPNIKELDYTVTNAKADSYQSKDSNKTAINAITNIKPYGLTIWGDRTLLKNAVGGLKAGSYLNLRNMLSDIKKELRDVALTLLFEQNSDVLWLKFKSRISPVLDKMVAGNGIYDYRLVKKTVKDKSKFSVEVIIQPIYPVEEVAITVVVTDSDVAVA